MCFLQSKPLKITIVLYQSRFTSMQLIASPCSLVTRRVGWVLIFQMSQPGYGKIHLHKRLGKLPNNKMKIYAFEIPLITALIKLMFPREWTFKWNFNSAPANSNYFILLGFHNVIIFGFTSWFVHMSLLLGNI